MMDNTMKTLELNALCEDIRSGDYTKAGKRFEHIVDSIIEKKLEDAKKVIIDKASKNDEDDNDDDNSEEEENSDKNTDE